MFEDSTPRFTAESDPFTIRFKVSPSSWLVPEHGVPIHDDAVWKRLSFTRDHDKEKSRWTGFFRGSLNRIPDEDGNFLERILAEQQRHPKAYVLTADDARALAPRTIRRSEGEISVTVPEDHVEVDGDNRGEGRESIRIQALLAKIGAKMGLKIWIPAGDKAAVLREWKAEPGQLVDNLPLNYDETTISTIERIDVLWLKGRSIVRAFEVEHTTAIYSGLLRMADLLSLQPNMDIKLHIVAPEARRDKVFEEIRRPVFSLLEPRPLSKSCTFLSYDHVREVGELPHLTHVAGTVLDEYAEEVE